MWRSHGKKIICNRNVIYIHKISDFHLLKLTIEFGEWLNEITYTQCHIWHTVQCYVKLIIANITMDIRPVPACYLKPVTSIDKRIEVFLRWICSWHMQWKEGMHCSLLAANELCPSTLSQLLSHTQTHFFTVPYSAVGFIIWQKHVTFMSTNSIS